MDKCFIVYHYTLLYRLFSQPWLASALSLIGQLFVYWSLLNTKRWLSEKPIVLLSSAIYGQIKTVINNKAFSHYIVNITSLYFALIKLWLVLPLLIGLAPRINAGIVWQGEVWDSTSFVQINNNTILLSLLPMWLLKR